MQDQDGRVRDRAPLRHKGSAFRSKGVAGRKRRPALLPARSRRKLACPGSGVVDSAEEGHSTACGFRRDATGNSREHVSSDAKVIEIRRRVYRRKFADPKNGLVRTIAVPPMTAALLREWMERAVDRSPEAQVFAGETGQPLWRSSMLVKDAGFPPAEESRPDSTKICQVLTGLDKVAPYQKTMCRPSCVLRGSPKPRPGAEPAFRVDVICPKLPEEKVVFGFA
jgi:hypothetical protein